MTRTSASGTWRCCTSERRRLGRHSAAREVSRMRFRASARGGWGPMADEGDIAIMYAQDLAAAARRCRVCGATDETLRGSIDQSGAPCRMIEDDLCSACGGTDDQ